MASPKTQHWLMKSEPDVYSIDDLKRDGRSMWEGVRNYQARNFMREMRVGDQVLFYHSNAKPPGVVGLAEVVREAYPDPTQFDKKSPYHDPKSSKDNPRWSVVDVAYLKHLPQVALQTLREAPKLEGMFVTQKGSRLSVQPVTAAHFREVVRMAERGGERSKAP